MQVHILYQQENFQEGYYCYMCGVLCARSKNWHGNMKIFHSHGKIFDSFLILLTYEEIHCYAYGIHVCNS